MRFFWKATPESRDHRGLKCKILRAVSFPDTLDVFDYCNEELQNKLKINRVALDNRITAKLALKSSDTTTTSTDTTTSTSTSTDDKMIVDDTTASNTTTTVTPPVAAVAAVATSEADKQAQAMIDEIMQDESLGLLINEISLVRFT